MRGAWQRTVSGTVNLFWPELCLCCESQLMRSQRVLCESCFRKLEKSSVTDCPRCGEHQEKIGKACLSCTERELFFSNFGYALIYSGLGKRLLERGKFHARRRVIKFLAQYARQSFLKASKNRVVVLLPSSHSFLYDLICSVEDSQEPTTIIMHDVFSQDRTEVATKKLSHHLRFRKLQNELKILNPPQASASVLLCDDIYTTGATLNQAARLLHEVVGTERAKISAWTLFRTNKRYQGDIIA